MRYKNIIYRERGWQRWWAREMWSSDLGRQWEILCEFLNRWALRASQVMRMILKWIQCCTGSQWRCWRMGVMRSLEWEWVSIQKAEFWTYCSFWRSVEERSWRMLLQNSDFGGYWRHWWVFLQWRRRGWVVVLQCYGVEKNDVLVMSSMCDSKERVGSRMIPKFYTKWEGVTM